jgi:hypothetical protein
MNVALLCERLHILPNEGGIFQQQEEDIKKLVIIFKHLDQTRKDEYDKISKSTNAQ